MMDPVLKNEMAEEVGSGLKGLGSSKAGEKTELSDSFSLRLKHVQL